MPPELTLSEKVKKFLSNPLGKKDLDAAAKAGDTKNPQAPVTQDNTYIKKQIDEQMKKKKKADDQTTPSPAAKKILGGEGY